MLDLRACHSAFFHLLLVSLILCLRRKTYLLLLQCVRVGIAPELLDALLFADDHLVLLELLDHACMGYVGRRWVDRRLSGEVFQIALLLRILVHSQRRHLGLLITDRYELRGHGTLDRQTTVRSSGNALTGPPALIR